MCVTAAHTHTHIRAHQATLLTVLNDFLIAFPINWRFAFHLRWLHFCAFFARRPTARHFFGFSACSIFFTVIFYFFLFFIILARRLIFCRSAVTMPYICIYIYVCVYMCVCVWKKLKIRAHSTSVCLPDYCRWSFILRAYLCWLRCNPVPLVFLLSYIWNSSCHMPHTATLHSQVWRSLLL